MSSYAYFCPNVMPSSVILPYQYRDILVLEISIKG